MKNLISNTEKSVIISLLNWVTLVITTLLHFASRKLEFTFISCHRICLLSRYVHCVGGEKESNYGKIIIYRNYENLILFCGFFALFFTQQLNFNTFQLEGELNCGRHEGVLCCHLEKPQQVSPYSSVEAKRKTFLSLLLLLLLFLR